MDYNCEFFDDYKQFKKNYSTIAKKLLNEVGEGAWQEDCITVYPSYEDYAIYELTDGWYIDCNWNRDYNGAPNPMDFIDLDALGQALVNTGDSSICIEIDDMIITTGYGW